MMYTRDSHHCGIDSIHCVELRFRRLAPGERMSIRARMVYSNKESGATMGTCPLIYDSARQETLDATLSPQTLELFNQFLESAEADLGRLVFEHGHTVGEGGQAEDNEEGLGGGR